MSDYEHDYPDHTQTPGFEAGDEKPCNGSGNPTFYDVIDAARASRRDFIFGGLAAAVAGVWGIGVGSRGAMAAEAGGTPLLGFAAVPVNAADKVVVPEGYRVQVMGAWGEPILGEMPAWKPGANSGAEQGMQIGMHHDGMHFFPIEGSSVDGLLVVNHEYIEPRFLHAAYAGHELDADSVRVEADGTRPVDDVLKEMNAHGVSVYRVRKEGEEWKIVEDVRNRRITARTGVEIGGPARGSGHMVTKHSPEGTGARGTFSNCAHGVTPWNTYLAAEENWAGYFVNRATEDGEPSLPREHSRYGVRTEERSYYGWERAADGADETARFDATPQGGDAAEDYRNEPNTFGWLVEIDPFDPKSTPVKRTGLGRFAHEGVVFAPATAGRPVVCYSGDDARFEYIYKFVSRDGYVPGESDGAMLDDGTLYVARFNPDGSGEWLALAPGENGLTPENGFADLADILVNARAAADLAGATKMDRPEWGAVDPVTGEVYFTLTNNNRRTEEQVDPVNPRAANQFGQIVRWKEAGGDHAARAFSWELFVLAGDEDSSWDLQGEPLTADSMFACPDGLWFDPNGRLWIQTDIGESQMNRGALEPMGNNAMLCADPRSGEIRRFLTGPNGQEITGVVMTPDARTMFVGVQHPGASTMPEDFAAGRINSGFPDYDGSVPRSATLVITREDGGVIGG